MKLLRIIAHLHQKSKYSAKFRQVLARTLVAKLYIGLYGSRLHQERELAENSPRARQEKNNLQNVARARSNSFSCQHFFVNNTWHLQFLLKKFLSCLRIHCCLYNRFQETANPLANQCIRSSETNLDKWPREKKQTLARVLGENRCRRALKPLRFEVSLAEIHWRESVQVVGC